MTALDHEELLEILPASMQTAKRWLVWKRVPQPGKKDRKVPYYVDHRPRGKGRGLDDEADDDALGTIEDAVRALGERVYAGLGFALGPDGTGNYWQGVDLDDFTKRPHLRELVDELPGYTEASPSGDGWHAVGYGREFATLGKNESGIEAYARGRFFTVTGDCAGRHDPRCLADFVEGRLQALHAKPKDSHANGNGTAVEVVDAETIVDLRSALLHLRADDRELWIRLGHACKTLGDAGRGIWLDWSATSEKFDAADAARTWDGFKPRMTDYRVVFSAAQAEGWVNPKKRAKKRELTEDTLALSFCAAEPLLRYVAIWNRWMTWSDTRWTEDSTLAVYDRVRAHVRSSRAPKEMLKASVIAAVERLAKADRRYAATSDQWDREDWLLNTPGGAISLRTGKLQDCIPEDYMTKLTGFAPAGACPTWMRFLEQVTGGDVEFVGFLQRVAGYAATGSTREHALFFAYGPGGNGKGVFLNTLHRVFGDYAAVSSMDTFTETHTDRHPTDLAMLRGARLVLAQETEEGRSWAESRIKALTGGDPITARYMRQDFFTFEPKFKLLIAGNHKPRLRNVDEAMRRRLYLLPFMQTFKGDRRDPDLAEKLLAEGGGILRWIVEGAIDYQRQGLNPPPVVVNATAEYFAAQDTFDQWLEDCCDRGVGYWEPAGLLFASWKKYAEKANESPGQQKGLGERMAKAGFASGNSRARGGRHWLGLRLKPAEEASSAPWLR